MNLVPHRLSRFEDVCQKFDFRQPRGHATARGVTAMRVCVFGAAGWTGRAVIRSLLARDDTTAVCAFDLHAGTWNGSLEVDGGAPDDPRVELRYGDLSNMEIVRSAVRHCDAIVHTTVATDGISATSSSKLYGVGEGTDDTTWLVNLKGLWNVLESAREEDVGMVVHIGSCHHSWPGAQSHMPRAVALPGSVFMDASARRPDGGIYATQKRLQVRSWDGGGGYSSTNPFDGVAFVLALH